MEVIAAVVVVLIVFCVCLFFVLRFVMEFLQDMVKQQAEHTEGLFDRAFGPRQPAPPEAPKDEEQDEEEEGLLTHDGTGVTLGPAGMDFINEMHNPMGGTTREEPTEDYFEQDREEQESEIPEPHQGT